MSKSIIHLDRPTQLFGWSGQVEFRGNLPINIGDPAIGIIYLVEKPTTILLGAYTTFQSGLYIRDANTGSLSDWRRLNVKIHFTDGEFAIVNSADQSKTVKLDASALTTSTTITASFQKGSGIIAYKVGIEAFFIQAKGLFGTGAGWADTGFINDTPVLLYSPVQTERAIFMFYGMARFIFDNIDPQVGFVVYSTSAPSAGNDDIRWQLEAVYVAETESTGKTPDETILQTQNMTTLVLNSRQTLLLFTIDRTKISDQDSMKFILTRIGPDGLDNYSSDVGVGQSGMILETFDKNP